MSQFTGAVVHRAKPSAINVHFFFFPYGHFIFDILVGIWFVKLAATELSVHLRATNKTPEGKTRNTDSQTHTHNTLTTFQRI